VGIPDSTTAGVRIGFGAIVRRLRMEERRASSHAVDIHCRAASKSQREEAAFADAADRVGSRENCFWNQAANSCEIAELTSIDSGKIQGKR
jgi:hypothetical protein